LLAEGPESLVEVGVASRKGALGRPLG